MEIAVITCGGTIDKVYFDALSDYQVGEPNIAGVFAQMRVGFRWTVQELLRKDSIAMDDADRATIRAAVCASPLSRILITHGTDTLVETARALLDIPDKRIVLTGAMLPATMRDSDAVFNIGVAVGVLVAGPTVPGGVWVAMNGQAFDPRRVRKDRAAGRFCDPSMGIQPFGEPADKP